MTLQDALLGVTRLGIDTTPVIYLVENHPRYAGLVQEVFNRVYRGDFSAAAGVVTLTEVLTQPRRAGDAALESTYANFLSRGRNFRLVPIDNAVADRAATLRARYGLRTPDALQIAAALSVGCQAILTNDHAWRRVTDLRALVLDDLEL